MRVQRHASGSVRYDKRRKTWNYLWYDGATRRSKLIGNKQEYPTKAAAWTEAGRLDIQEPETPQQSTLTVKTLATHYREEKMPKRKDTRRSYEVWLRNHITPKWGDCLLNEVQARPVELWLNTLSLAPKSKAHIRGVLSLLWDYAMWRGDVPTQRNPMTLVTVKGATKRKRQPRSLTVEEFRSFATHLPEPFRTMALLCVCLGLRISECLALKWSDVDWLNGKLCVERGIVCQNVDEVKTPESQQKLVIDGELLTSLKMWKQVSQLSSPENWVFASPVRHGRFPWSYDQVWRQYQKAAKSAGIGGLGTHCLRHTYRTWLDSVGTPVGVMQKLMRHTDVRTTMNTYGDAATDEMSAAHSRVVGLALNRAQAERSES
ncbi:MAG TPA: site-specific integrase [Candidatus Sulfotelmatobacter sp.]|nr:site-specific integrase [Candidatus Sulfotelmatobacter sp.]